MRRVLPVIGLGMLAAVLLSGCTQEMMNQRKYKPLAKSDYFPDGSSARMPVEDAVARGTLKADDHLHRGRVNGQLATEFPFPITPEVMTRGRERFNIFCANCHDQTGSGQGMVVKRGFLKAASFHEPRLREAPVGYFFHIVTNGFGNMPSFAHAIPAEDRWAIIAYVRALQLAKNADAADLTAAEKAKLK